MSGDGGSWRRSTAQAGNLEWMCVPTAMLASSIISSTIMLVSLKSYMLTSRLFVEPSTSCLCEILTSGDARLSAPASYLQRSRGVLKRQIQTSKDTMYCSVSERVL